MSCGRLPDALHHACVWRYVRGEDAGDVIFGIGISYGNIAGKDLGDGREM